MTTLSITITEETDYETMMAVSTFIKQFATLTHGEDPQLCLELNQEPKEPEGKEVESVKETPSELPVSESAPSFPVPSPKKTDLALDSEGIPWDERIHSAQKTILADGTWRRRRGTPDGVFRQVTAELRNRMGSLIKESVTTTPNLPEPQVLKVPPPPPPPPSDYVTPAQPLAKPEVVGEPQERSFDELMSLITDIVTDELLNQEEVESILKSFEMEELSDLKEADPTRVAEVYQTIERAAK